MPIQVTCACGKQCQFGDEFAGWLTKCPACGKAVAVPRAGAGVGSGAQLPAAPRPRKKRRTALFVILGAAGLVVVAGVLVAAFYLPGGPPSSAAPRPPAPAAAQPAPAAPTGAAPAAAQPAPAVPTAAAPAQPSSPARDNRDEQDYEGPLPSNAPVLEVTYEYADWSLPFLVALKKGYFRKLGIDIKPTKVDGRRPPLRFGDMDIVNGHTFGLMGESGSSPRSVRFVHPFLYTRDGPMITGFLMKRSAQITKWSDFKGRKTCELALRSLEDLGLIGKILEREGVEWKGAGRFQFALGGDTAKVFEEQEAVIGMYGWGGGIQDLMRRKPNDYVLLAKNLSAQFVSDPFFVACTYINIDSPRTKPEVIRKYVDAIDQAIDYIRRSPERALAIVPKYMDFTPEAAARLAVYHFCKSSEPVDFGALKKSTDLDLKGFLYQVR